MTTAVIIQPAGHTVEVTEVFEDGTNHVTVLTPGDPEMRAHIWDGKSISIREVK